MKIIGITGTLGAGKGTIVSYLVNRMGFRHFSVRAYLIREIQKHKLEVNRDNMVKTANNLRARHSPSYIAEQLYEEAVKTGEDCVIESLRTVGEVEALSAKGGFTLLAVDADQRLRYDRILARGSETDFVSFEVFCENEKREMKSNDPGKQNISACMKLADHIFENNNSIAELHANLENVLKSIEDEE